MNHDNPSLGELAERATRALWDLEDELDRLESHHRSPTATYDIRRLKHLRKRWELDTEHKLTRAGILSQKHTPDA